MIWLFKIDEVFWNNQPEVSEFYTFNVDNVHFDITKYDISLYFGLADYFLLSDLNEDDVYQLRLESINRNPTRAIIPKNTQIYHIIKEFYVENNRNL